MIASGRSRDSDRAAGGPQYDQALFPSLRRVVREKTDAVIRRTPVNIGTANGKIFLLYAHAEEGNVRKMRKQLASEGIIAIPCDDPANFRFVTPEVLPTGAEGLDLIGRTALKYLGEYSAHEKFVKELRKALAPENAPASEPVTQPEANAK